MGKKKNDGARQDRSASRNGLTFILQSPIFLHRAPRHAGPLAV